MCWGKRQSYIVRLLAFVLCLLLFVAVLPGYAYALSGSTGGLSWSLSGGTLTISGSGAMPDYTDVNMPPWYASANAINRIVVDEGVTSIGSLAFYGCTMVQKASLPSTVTSIGDRAFKNCIALTYVSLPEGLESIGQAAFERCESLNGILLPDSLHTLESYAFERCTALTSITIPAGVTNLGMVIFYHCTSLTRATICCPISKVPDWLFYGCTALVAVDLPETITKTGDQAFYDCENLSTVYYAGEAANAIEEALSADKATRYAVVSENMESGIKKSSTTIYNDETDESVTISVIRSEAAIITETTTTSYTYTVDGEQATFGEVMNANETENVEIAKKKKTVVSATVSGTGGWQDLADAAKDAIANRSGGKTVSVDVQLTGSTVSGMDLAELAGMDTKLTISTNEGNSWIIDTAKQSTTGLGRTEIDLDFSVEKMEAAVKGIDSSTVYRVRFASSISFRTVVGVPLQVGSARHYATLFEKTLTGVTELGSVVVDDTGYAWFPVETINQGTEYFVAVNDARIDSSDATIPDSMLDDYGGEYVETLTDASGKQYQVGDRESSWGITGKQFAIYAAIVVVAIVLIVTGTMITLNRINRSKAKYAAMAAADAEDYEIDEEELRLQIMQEMLEEAQKGKSEE